MDGSSSIVKVLLAIVGLGLVATVLVNYKGTEGVVGTLSTGFNKSLATAEKG